MYNKRKKVHYHEVDILKSFCDIEKRSCIDVYMTRKKSNVTCLICLKLLKKGIDD